MSPTTTNVDYIKNNFKYPVLTKILGKPDYESLKAIKDELKANAGKVQCNLGGSNNGNLGLVLSDVDYALVSPNTPYVHLVHPNAVAPQRNTQWENTVLRDQWKEEIWLF